VQYGEVGGALEVFEELASRDVVSWTVMMAGYASQGNYSRVIRCFHMMLQEGLVPDDIAFTTVLEACKNAALLREVFLCFEFMTEDQHPIAPEKEHYSCLSSTLAQSGMVRDAFELMRTIPWAPDSIMSMSFLKNCCYFGRVQESSEQMKDPSNSSSVNSGSSPLPIGNYGFSEARDSSKLAHITHIEKAQVDHDGSCLSFHFIDLGIDGPQPQGALDISNDILLSYI
jgi:pentatricopeptide repeat protein